jgi:hypothetical protein
MLVEGPPAHGARATVTMSPVKPSEATVVESRSMAVAPVGRGMEPTTLGFRASFTSRTVTAAPAHAPEAASVAATAVVPTTVTSP